MARKTTNWVQCTIDQTLGTLTAQAMRVVDDKPAIDPAHQPIVFRVEDASAANRAYAMFHGFKQRIVDAMAADQGTSIADKLDAARAIVDHLASGSQDWNIARATKPKRDLTPEEKRALIAKWKAEGIDLE